jgi:hypothetical protein
MNLNVYAIYDKLQQTFMTPMFQHNDGTMLRMIQQAVNDKESYIYKNPQDYSIYQIGEWNDKGELTGLDNNRKVVEAVELVDKKERIDETEIEKLNSNMNQMRAVVDSLKTLVVGQNQAM